MIIDLPFYYFVEAMLPQKRTFTRMLVRDSLPVKIAEMDDADLVATVPQNPETGEGETHYYHRQGSFWATFEIETRDGRMKVDPKLMAEIMVRGRQVDGISLPFKNGEPVMYEGRSYDGIDALNARELKESTRDEAVADIETRISGFGVIDGMAVNKVGEPVLNVVSRRDSGVSVKQGLTVTVIALPEDTKNAERLYRLDHFDRLAEVRAGRFRNEIELFGPAPQVFRPDLLTWNRERTQFVHRLVSEFEGFIGSRSNSFADMSVDSFVAYTELRRIVPLLSEDSDHMIDEAGAAIKALRQTYGNVDANSGPFQWSAGVYEKLLAERSREASDTAALSTNL